MEKTDFPASVSLKLPYQQDSWDRRLKTSQGPVRGPSPSLEGGVCINLGLANPVRFPDRIPGEPLFSAAGGRSILTEHRFPRGAPLTDSSI